MIAGFTAEEVLHEALVRPRDARVALAGTKVIRRPGWSQVITPAFRQGGLNSVDLAQLDPDEADAVIDATIAEYDALGLRFRWNVTPDSRPADLAARLERRGLVGERVLVMAAALDRIHIAPPAAVTVEEVDATSARCFGEVTAAGWGMDPSPLIAHHRALLAEPAGRDHHAFIARVAGEPAGAANYVVFERSAHLMGAVVLPAWRHRGAYLALVAARLAHAAARGVRLVTTQARASTSAPIAARLGFVTVAEARSYSRHIPPT